VLSARVFEHLNILKTHHKQDSSSIFLQLDFGKSPMWVCIKQLVFLNLVGFYLEQKIILEIFQEFFFVI